MARPTSAVIVGAGIVGLSTAWHLLRRGVRVTILDREPIGASASCGNAGLLSIGHYPLTRPGAALRGLRWMFNPTSPLYIRPRFSRELLRWLWDFHRHCTPEHLARCMPVLCDMGFRSLAICEAMIREESIDCDYARDGWLDVVLRAANMDDAEKEAQGIVPFGYSYRRLDGDEARRFDPVLRDEVAGAIHYTDSAHAHPALLLAGLAAGCLRKGATLRTDATVTGFARDRAGRIAGATLADGSVIEADVTVLAAGIWSSAMAASLGVRLPMVGARGYHLQVQGLPRLPRTGMVLHETFIAVTPMRQSLHGSGVDELRLAGTLEIDELGRPWRRERLAMLPLGAQRYLHGLERGAVVGEWAGYRPCTSDGLPILGFARQAPGLLLATGHAMMGMTLGPVTGAAACSMLFDEKPEFDCALLDPLRFG